MGYADKAQYSSNQSTRPSSGGQAKKSFNGQKKKKSNLPPLTHSVKSKDTGAYVASIFASEMVAADGTPQINLNITEAVAQGVLYISTKKGLVSSVITSEEYEAGNPTHGIFSLKEDGTTSSYVEGVAIWQTKSPTFDSFSLKVIVNNEIPAGKYAIRLTR